MTFGSFEHPMPVELVATMKVKRSSVIENRVDVVDGIYRRETDRVGS